MFSSQNPMLCVLFVAFAAVLGCGNDPAAVSGTPGCVPGVQALCPCGGGGQGVQVCQPDGKGYGACGGCTEQDVGPAGDADAAADAIPDTQAEIDDGADASGELPQDVPQDVAPVPDVADAELPIDSTGAPTCGNGAKDGLESDVDCGGPSCGACAVGMTCKASEDCQSKQCVAGACLPAPTCTDGAKNGMETDVDCGGGNCPACSMGAACLEAKDCASTVCAAGSCLGSALCVNKKQDGLESDVDCGGKQCLACAPGQGCAVGLDCSSGVCKNAVCQDPVGCSNGKKDNLETAIDCGGIACPACADGSACAKNSDCALNSCVAGLCQPPLPKCNDGQKNGTETDVDCGGAACELCKVGGKCAVNGDCLSASCVGGICKDVISCSDGKKNGPETDTDCGGSCGPCGPNKACVAGTDCTSKLCANSFCTSPSCSDQVLNGLESAVDCGGSGSGCIPCPLGATCKTADQCLSQYCLNGSCKALPSCTDGAKNSGETDIDCGGPSCQPCVPGKTCLAKGDCNGGACLNNLCQKVDCTIAKVCDDGNVCTQDTCSQTGCVLAAVAGVVACSDGDACTSGDICSAKVCMGGGPKNCSDGSICTDDTCENTKGCLHANNVVPCSDGNACTLADACAGGSCVPSGELFCNDDKACTVDSCDPAKGCVFSVSCDDKNGCTADSCDAGTGCVYTLVAGTACDDGDKCTGPDKCDTAGKCQAGPGVCLCTSNAGCDDANACTTDTCTANKCFNIISNVALCNDNNPCTTDTCDPVVGCVHAPAAGIACEDGSNCTGPDKCNAAGKCQAGPVTCQCQTNANCDDSNDCTIDKCIANKCVNTVTSSATCDDKNPCSLASKCNSTGACIAEATKMYDCSAQNDLCNIGVCYIGTTGAAVCKKQAKPKGVSCDDGDLCTVTDTCWAGSCKGVAKCGANEFCKVGACIAAPSGMALIPAGKFLMGCVSADTGCLANEKPQHEVDLPGFYMDLYEVTVAAYAGCVAAGNCTVPNSANSYSTWGKVDKEQHPVNGVTWFQAQAFCNWIGGRLPTEAEWEKASRGGLLGKKFPWGDTDPTCMPGQANTAAFSGNGGFGCGTNSTWKVGTGSSMNGHGLYDMSGNVWEWVNDWHDSYGAWPASNPQGPASGSVRVMRGGSIAYYSAHLRSSFRHSDSPSAYGGDLGFRCARSLP